MRFFLTWFILAALCLFLISCGGTQPKSTVRGTSSYTVRGETYYPLQTGKGYVEEGEASWYGPGFHGKTTANGERYNQNAMTAAHKTLPLGTDVRVTHLENGKSVVLRINDRGPFLHGRIIDLSRRAADKLEMKDAGKAHVRVEAISENGVPFSNADDLATDMDTQDMPAEESYDHAGDDYAAEDDLTEDYEDYEDYEEEDSDDDGGFFGFGGGGKVKKKTLSDGPGGAARKKTLF